jgi:hypothetical protein
MFAASKYVRLLNKRGSYNSELAGKEAVEYLEVAGEWDVEDLEVEREEHVAAL